MPELFESTRIKSMKIRNRIVRSATNESMSEGNGFPGEKLVKLYEKLARGGVGLIITGNAYVSPEGRNSKLTMIGIDRDEHVPAYREITEAVHKNGCSIVMQINHCGRQTSVRNTGETPIGPSAVRDLSTMEKPRMMTEEDIERLIEAFAQAARRVKESGFDGVQVHAAHGYLISSFLCPHTNRRKDKWGGTLENRMRFLSEIYRRCRKEVGDDYPVLIKINGYDNMRKGVKLEEGVLMAEMAAEMGFDGIEVSCGIAEDGISTVRGDFPAKVIADDVRMLGSNPVLRFFVRHFGKLIVRPLPFCPQYNREAAKLIKSKIDKPVFAVGGITSPDAMDDIITTGDADYVSLSRPLINDPKYPKKIKEGSREASRCIKCNLCLYYTFVEKLRCYNGKPRK